MEATLLAALISVGTSISVLLIGHLLTTRSSRAQARLVEQAEINSRYLSPLRLQTLDVEFRFREIQQQLRSSKTSEGLLALRSASEMAAKPVAWYTGEGCFMASTCYLVGGLFARLAQLRSDIPYVRLTTSDDTELLRHTHAVAVAFLQDHGVYYVIQPSIGHDMLADGGVVSYRQFVELLQQPDRTDWFEPIVRLVRHTGLNDDGGARLQRILESLAALRVFLDHVTSGGDSMSSRLSSE